MAKKKENHKYLVNSETLSSKMQVSQAKHGSFSQLGTDV